jgi:hypothetical protein
VTSDDAKHPIRWRLGLIVGVIMMILALLPQIHFVIHRGRDWRGANAITHPDEVAYSAYTASLVRDNPRRYDPFTGRGAEAGAAESLFSIQLIPAYTIALPGRWLKISAATLFVIFSPLCAFAASLAIFCFLSLLTRDARLSAAGVVVILCLGTLVAGQGMARHVLNLNFLIPMWLSLLVLPTSLYHLPFLRIYQPALAFPLFFLLGALVWRALNESRSALNAAFAGLTLAGLVFSYFFLWTAAVAWLACLALVWTVFRRIEFKRVAIVFAIIGAIALPAMIGYFVMLSHRAATVDTAQALVLTHGPDLFRMPEIISVIVLLTLAVASWRRLFAWREPVALFAVSLALMVFAIFNQQVITGRSLQPIHYEWFIGNYGALAALVLAAKLCWRNQTSSALTNRRLAIIAAIALAWGVGEVWLAASIGFDRNHANDEFRPVATRLTSLAQAQPSPGTVLVSDLALADRLPTDAPQTLLWAPHMLVFPGVNETEDRERFLRQLYYLGYDEQKILSEIGKRDWNFFAGLFPYERLSPVITGKWDPITPDEIRAHIKKYRNYAASFDRQTATSAPVLSYVVVRAGEQVDFQNLDRWYKRDGGEPIGDFVLYRVNLR